MLKIDAGIMMLAGTVMCFGTNGLAGADGTPPALPAVAVLKIQPDERPVIDGRLDEDFWQDCSTVELQLVVPPGGAPAQRTASKIATDGSWLFVGIAAADNTLLDDAAAQTPLLNTRQDYVEFHLDPGTAGKRHFRFAVNRFGHMLADLKGIDANPGHAMHWRAAGAAAADGWSVEMALPLFYFAEVAGAGPGWRVNFCRLDTAPAEISSWAPVLRKFAEPEHFGRLENLPAGLPPAGQLPRRPFAPRLTYILAGPTTDQTGEYVSLVRIGMVNDSSNAGGAVSLHLRDESVPGQPMAMVTNVALKPGEHQCEATMELKRPLEFIPRPEVTLSLRDEMGTWAQTMAHGQGAIVEKYAAWLDHSYYTLETQAVLYVETAGDQPPPSNASVQTVLINSAGSNLWAGPARPAAPGVWRAAIPLAELPPARYTLEVQVRNASADARPERKIAVLNKLPPAPAGREVKIDHFNRCVLIGDQPFFPFGVCWMPAHSADLDLAHLKALGFNTVIRWTRFDGSPDDNGAVAARVGQDSLLAAAEKHGITVVEQPKSTRQRDAGNQRVWRWIYPRFVENYHDWKANDLPAVMAVMRAHPAVAAYLAIDEPSDVIVQPGNVPLARLLNDMMASIVQLDPYKPVFLNFGGMLPDRMEWLDNQSFFASFNYWLVQPDAAATAVRLAATLQHNSRLAEKYRKPLWLMPTTELNWSAQAVPMSAAENRTQLYIMLIHGAKGINYFSWPWLHAATDASLAELAREVQVLAPALLRRRPAQRVTYATAEGRDNDAGALMAALLVEPDDTPLLMFLNAGAEPVRIRCSLPWLDGEHRLASCFDASHADFKDGSFHAEFDPLATRIYRISGASITNAWQRHDILIRVEREIAEVDATGGKPANLIPDALFNDASAWLIRERDAGKVDFAAQPGNEPGRMLILDGAAGGGIYARSPRFRLRPYHRYRLSATVRYEKAGGARAAGMSLRAADAGDAAGELPALQCGNPAQPEWQAVERVLQAHADHPASVRLVIYWNAPAGGRLCLKDISLLDLGPATNTASSKNRVPNPSFEDARLPGWPDYWQPRGFDRAILTEHRLGMPGAPWQSDDDHPFHGRVSLRMAPAAGATASTPFQRAGFGIPAEESRPFEFTAWLRAENEHTPVRIVLRGLGSKTFEVGPAWTRVAMSGVKTNPLSAAYRDFTAITISAPGTVWVDAVCLAECDPAAPAVKKD